jgi:hypothetical protein
MPLRVLAGLEGVIDSLLLTVFAALLTCSWLRFFECRRSGMPTRRVGPYQIPKYCVLSYAPRTVSNERDLAISCALKAHPRVAECFLSLRSAARLVLLVERGHVIEPNFGFLLGAAQAEVVRMPNKGYMGLFHNRWSWMLDYLRVHIAEYDRVLWFDSFDVFFQSDPFGVINPANVTLFTEGVLIRGCRINSLWLRNCFGRRVVRQIAHQPVLNGGVVAGQARPFLKFLEVFIPKPKDWVHCPISQNHLNYLAHTGAFTRAVLGYVIRGCDAVAHLHWCRAYWGTFRVAGKTYLSKIYNGKPPPILHANGRAKKQFFNLIQRCAVWITDHVGPEAVSRDLDPLDI